METLIRYSLAVWPRGGNKMRARPWQAFTIIEIVVTMAVLTVGILVILSSFSMNLRQSSQTREELQAHLFMENLVEEVLEHPYGSSAPASWNNFVVSDLVVVEGKRVKSDFTRNVITDPDIGNGSYFGKSRESIDHVVLQINWSQASAQGNAAEERSLQVKLSVARRI